MNIYKKLNLTKQKLIQKQKTFPLITCIKSPTHKNKNKKTNIEEDINSLEINKEYKIMRTDLKDENKNDLYLIVGSVDGLLFMNKSELKEYFDLSPLNNNIDNNTNNSITYKLEDAPYYKTGMIID